MYVRGCRAARGWAGEDRVAREVAPLGAEAGLPLWGCSVDGPGAGRGSALVLAAGVQWRERQPPSPK